VALTDDARQVEICIEPGALTIRLRSGVDPTISVPIHLPGSRKAAPAQEPRSVQRTRPAGRSAQITALAQKLQAAQQAVVHFFGGGAVGVQKHGRVCWPRQAASMHLCRSRASYRPTRHCTFGACLPGKQRGCDRGGQILVIAVGTELRRGGLMWRPELGTFGRTGTD